MLWRCTTLYPVRDTQINDDDDESIQNQLSYRRKKSQSHQNAPRCRPPSSTLLRHPSQQHADLLNPQDRLRRRPVRPRQRRPDQGHRRVEEHGRHPPGGSRGRGGGRARRAGDGTPRRGGVGKSGGGHGEKIITKSRTQRRRGGGRGAHHKSKRGAGE